MTRKSRESSPGIKSPPTLDASPAKNRSDSTPLSNSFRASASGLPHSRVMILVISSRCLTHSSYHRIRTAARSFAGRVDQGLNAAAAAWMARFVSSAPHDARAVMAAAVAGFSTVYVLLAVGRGLAASPSKGVAAHSPSIR